VWVVLFLSSPSHSSRFVRKTRKNDQVKQVSRGGPPPGSLDRPFPPYKRVTPPPPPPRAGTPSVLILGVPRVMTLCPGWRIPRKEGLGQRRDLVPHAQRQLFAKSREPCGRRDSFFLLDLSMKETSLSRMVMTLDFSLIHPVYHMSRPVQQCLLPKERSRFRNDE